MDHHARRRAAALAGHTGDEVTARSLLPDASPPVRAAALAALVRMGQATATDARDHADPLCREAAVAALGAIGDPAGLPAILHATGDRPAIRRRAVIALTPFDGPDVDAALHRALTDRDWQVREAAEELSRDVP